VSCPNYDHRLDPFDQNDPDDYEGDGEPPDGRAGLTCMGCGLAGGYHDHRCTERMRGDDDTDFSTLEDGENETIDF
jgi:hypothetical protein